MASRFFVWQAKKPQEYWRISRIFGAAQTEKMPSGRARGFVQRFPRFKAAFNQPDVKKYILSGHGGEMAERYNKQPEAKKIQQKNDQQIGK